MGAFEAALEAWGECHPDGMSLAEERLLKLLPDVAARVPGGLDSPDAARRLHGLFNSKHGRADCTPLFVQMLRPHGGRVHFLYFWRAFGEAARLVSETTVGVSAGDSPDDDPPGLTDEVERLRDRVLDRLWKGRCDDPPVKLIMKAPELQALVFAAAKESIEPDFWQHAARALTGLGAGETMGPEWLAVAMLSWFHDALARQPHRELDESLEQGCRGLPVRVHVYDVSQEESIQTLNSVLAHENSPLKFGGVFHAGVEVSGLEWSFGQSLSENAPGISCCEPRGHPQHHFRETVLLGRTQHSQEDIADMIQDFIEQYPGDDYDLLRRNCCHFADEFCQRLGVGGIPRWVHRLAYIGATLDSAYHAAQSLQGKFQDILNIPVEAEAEEADEHRS